MGTQRERDSGKGRAGYYGARQLGGGGRERERGREGGIGRKLLDGVPVKRFSL